MDTQGLKLTFIQSPNGSLVLLNYLRLLWKLPAQSVPLVVGLSLFALSLVA